jgi:hypothetical protein
MIDNPALPAASAASSPPPGDPPRRRRPERETTELAAMLARMLRAMTRRAAAGDLDALGELARLAPLLELAIHQSAVGLHSAPGLYSWTEIAAELGVTRQAARQRFDP